MALFLVVDDEQHIRNLIKQYIGEMGHESDVAANGEEALKMIFEKKYTGMFTDVRMPGLDGITLLNAIREEQFKLPTVVVSAYANVELVTEAFKLGILDFITKPFSPNEIKAAVTEILKQTLDIKESSQYIRGMIEQKAFSQARDYICKLFSVYPDSPIPHFLYAYMKEIMGNKDEAVKHYKASVALDGGYDPSKNRLSNLEAGIEG